MTIARRVVTALIPHGIVRMVIRKRGEKERLKYLAESKKNYVIASSRKSFESVNQASYETLIIEAVRAGLPEQLVRGGSIPRGHIEVIIRYLTQIPNSGRGLHIGNFVGVSLAAIASFLVERDKTSLIVAVDPNVPHRGVDHPQDVVCRLLATYGLLSNVVLICGYSSTWNPSNDGAVFEDYDPLVFANEETAPTHVLRNLAALGLTFDWGLVDGNHNGDYLTQELSELENLIRPGGILFLDDCDQWWPEILEAFQNHGSNWNSVGLEGRIGILRRASHPQ